MQGALIKERPPATERPPSARRFKGLTARPLQHGMQQHIATRRDVLWLGILNLVVRYTILAGNEDHARRRQPRHVDGIVACAGYGIHV